MVSFLINLISETIMCKKEVGLSCDKFRHMLMVNGLGAGFGTPCQSFMYDGCYRSSLVKFGG